MSNQPSEETDRQSQILRVQDVSDAVFRNRKLVIALPTLMALLLVALGLFKSTTYTSATSFLPESGGSMDTRLGNLASQLGFTIPTGEPDRSPQFYESLLQSRELLVALSTSEFEIDSMSDSTADLTSLYKIRGDSEAERVERAVEKLLKSTRVSSDLETSILTFSASASSPSLAVQLVQRALDLVNEFDARRRQTHATAERQFVQGRMVSVERELHEAEDSLASFLRENRRFESSPELQFERDRRARRVSMQQEVYTSLAQALEQSKINEVRNTPVITILDSPFRPVRPDSKYLWLRVVLGILIGAGIAGVATVGREARRRDP